MLPAVTRSLTRHIYELSVKKSLMDDTDMEIIEEIYLSLQQEIPIASLKLIMFVWTVVTVVGAVCSASYNLLGCLLAPLLFVGVLKAMNCFCYCIASFYVNAVCSFDATFHRTVATIRSREIAFFGLRRKFDMNTATCLRSLRRELLKGLRCAVQSHVYMSERMCGWDESEKLLSRIFSSEISRLALQDDICDEFLQLSSLKELWQLLFLLRSEYVRIFLRNLSHLSYKLILIFADLLWKAVLLRNIKSRLSNDLDFIGFREKCLTKKDLQKCSTLSTADRVQAYLYFASEILNDNELPEQDKFSRVIQILKEVIEILSPDKNAGHESTKQSKNSHSDLTSESSTSSSANEAESLKEELSVERVYEGTPTISDEEQDMFFPSWEEKSNDAARSVLMELKERLGERNRKKDTAKVGDVDGSHKDGTVEELRKSRTSGEERVGFVEPNAEETTVDQSDTVTYPLLPKNADAIQSHLKMDLKEALSLRKAASSVCFSDSLGNNSSSDSDT